MRLGTRTKLAMVGVAILATVAFTAWFAARVSNYRQLLGYSPDQDYRYEFAKAHGRQMAVNLDVGGFRWPEGIHRWDSAFLQLKVDTGLLGALNDPYITVQAGGQSFRQSLERGAKGVRFLNLSPLAGAKLAPGALVSIKGQYISWPVQPANLVLFRNKLPPLARVLVIAPHPDDAEIAAFGLYSHRDSYVVTLTAGEAGDGFFEPFNETRRRRHILKGKLRVWDSIAVPYWGGLGLGRACNLGYFDKTMSWMYHHPDQEVTSPSLQSSDLKLFRRCIWASMLQDKKLKATWNNLVADLVYILKNLKPYIIVAPHPFLDQHPDHRYGALAVFQAIQEAGLSQGELLLYTNHNILSEIYPYGDDDALVTLPPWFGDNLPFTKIYSYQMQQGQQTEKFFALEAMHDLRPPSSEHANSLDLLSQGMDKAMAELMDLDDVRSYFRRAVRPNELFFTVPMNQAAALDQACRKLLK